MDPMEIFEARHAIPPSTQEGQRIIRMIAKHQRRNAVAWTVVALLLGLLTGIGFHLITENDEFGDRVQNLNARLIAQEESNAKDAALVATIKKQLTSLVSEHGKLTDAQIEARLKALEGVVAQIGTAPKPGEVIGGVPGPQGVPGPTGPRGPPGSPGAKGDIGPQGDIGAEGLPGSPGPAGEAGATGDTGPAGPAGATGAQGATGPAGPAGPAGPQGEVGPIGPAGPSGPQGASVGSVTCAVDGTGSVENSTFSFTFTLSDGTTLTATCTVQ